MPTAPRKRLLSPTRLILLIAVAAGIALYAFNFGGNNAAKGPPVMNPWTGPTPVRTVTADASSLDLRLRAIGAATPLRTVTVRTRVEGELTEILFQEGQHVEAGQLLARIDPRPYQIALAQAEGQQQQNLAQLRNAELDLKRYQTLYKQDSIARQQLDSQQALVRQYQGTTKIDQARVDDAKLQLSYTRIEAPVAGRIGLRAVDVGNIVKPGDADGLAVITQMRPMSVVFAIPETQLADVRAQLVAGRELAVEAWDRDETTLLAQGRLSTLDNRIDTATGTVRLRAEFANDDERLFPNQFLNVSMQVRRIDAAVVAPADAVQYGANGAFVYVITPESTATVRPVTLGPTDDGRIVIASGVAAGEQVAIEGLDRLREGRAVQVVTGIAAERQSGQAGRAAQPGQPAASRPGGSPPPGSRRPRG